MSMNNSYQKSNTFHKVIGYARGNYPSAPYQLHQNILLHSHDIHEQCHSVINYHGGIDSHA